jgi:NAD(P)-dependent dehydrogenase (short-subunit alcohol dehydrogenase family)
MNLNKLQSLYDFSNRTVLVTAGISGLSIEIVRTLAECNANVIVLSRNQVRATKALMKLVVIQKAMGPMFYILYHHLYNSWSIYQFERKRI